MRAHVKSFTGTPIITITKRNQIKSLILEDLKKVRYIDEMKAKINKIARATIPIPYVEFVSILTLI